MDRSKRIRDSDEGLKEVGLLDDCMPSSSQIRHAKIQFSGCLMLCAKILFRVAPYIPRTKFSVAQTSHCVLSTSDQLLCMYRCAREISPPFI
jgi:hypothetical protein